MNPYETQSYELADGKEIYRYVDMTPQEAERENEIIRLGTDGNIWFQPVVKEQKTPAFEPSQGHITTLNGLEYFLRNGELYRASVANTIANDGYRTGGRWQAPAHLVKSVLETLGIKVVQ